MNASQYRHRTNSSRYPFFVSALIIAGGLALFYLIKMFFFGGGGDFAEVSLSVPPENTVYVQFADDEENGYKPVSASSIPFLEKESIKSRNTTGSALQFFDDSEVLLDKKTEVVLEKSRMHKGETREIEVAIKDGKIWVDVAPSLNPRSEFVVQLGENEFAKSNNGEFSVDYEDEVIKVAGGIVRVSKIADNEEVFYTDVGVGQQFSFLGDIGQNSLAILAEDPWFSAHKQGIVETNEESEKEGTSEEESDQNSSSENDENEKEVSGEVQILVPGGNGSRVKISKDPIEISGLVPGGTVKVTVDDYTLQKFESGNTTFAYTAAEAYENLDEGENTYSVQAYNADDDLISEAVITVVYTPEKSSESEDASSEDPETDNSPQEIESSSEIKGVLKITAPTEDSEFAAGTTDPVTLSGTAPSNAAKVTVNGYALSKFSEGSNTWQYFINQEYGNMESGKNLYEVKAFDADDTILGSDVLTITFPELPEEEKEEEAGPINQWEQSAEEAQSSGEAEVTQ